MKSVTQAPITAGSKVFVRCDLDVPMQNGQPQETYRIETAIPTLKYIIERGGIPIIAGHMGKPNGKPDLALSTKQLRPFFESQLLPSDFILYENLRFLPGEEENSDEYAKQLASQADIYVNESFATSHRKHASIVGVPKYLPSYMGLRFEQEITTLTKLLKNPDHPFTVLISGIKLESKLPLASKFVKVADTVLLGGRLGLEWKDEVPSNLKLPTDYVPEQKDLGPNTVAEYLKIIEGSKTVLIAGPLGMYEVPEFAKATNEIVKKIAQLTQAGQIYSVMGGGDIIAAAQRVVDLKSFTFVSTGGGAMLQFLVDGTLPGIEALG